MAPLEQTQELLQDQAVELVQLRLQISAVRDSVEVSVVNFDRLGEKLDALTSAVNGLNIAMGKNQIDLAWQRRLTMGGVAIIVTCMGILFKSLLHL